MKFAILMKMDLGGPLMRWAQLISVFLVLKFYFLCHEVWTHIFTMCWFSWMISNFGMVLLFVIIPKLSFIPVSFSVPVSVLPGIVEAMAPLRTCFLLLLPVLSSSPWHLEEVDTAFLHQSDLKGNPVLLQSTATVSLDLSWWKKR